MAMVRRPYSRLQYPLQFFKKSVGIKMFSETMRPTTQVSGIGLFSLLLYLAIGFCFTFGFQSISFVGMHQFHSTFTEG